MPESRKERNPSSVSLGDVSVSTAAFTSGTQTNDFQSVEAGTYNVASGKYKVSVYNDGLMNITVNGDTVKPSSEWIAEAVSNTQTKKFEYTPAVVIVVPANGSATYSWNGPST